MSATAQQIPLERKQRPPHFDHSHEIGVVTKSLPFFRRLPDGIVHRVRSGTVYWLRVRPSSRPHTAINFWCGNTGFISHDKNGTLLAEIPANAIRCAACELKFERRKA